MKAYEKCKTCKNTWHLDHSTPYEMYNPCMFCCYEPSYLLSLENGEEIMGTDNYEKATDKPRNEVNNDNDG